jgi:hypothetical protein
MCVFVMRQDGGQPKHIGTSINKHILIVYFCFLSYPWCRVEVSGQVLCPWERARCVHWIGERMDVVNRFDVVRNTLSPAGNQIPIKCHG